MHTTTKDGFLPLQKEADGFFVFEALIYRFLFPHISKLPLCLWKDADLKDISAVC